jgi:serine/threonine protein kinase
MQVDKTKELEVPAGFSPELSDLIEKLLVKDPKQRITAAEALSHPFFNPPGLQL